MIAYLLRHAEAGARRGDHRDRYRPLTARGTDQAATIATFFVDKPITHIRSSPASRCVQTVERTAAYHQLVVNESEQLWEDATPANVLALINTNPSETTLFCTHGNLIPEVIEMLGQQGVSVSSRRCQKGSLWVLTGHDNNWETATYLSPMQIERQK